MEILIVGEITELDWRMAYIRKNVKKPQIKAGKNA
jgi:hypothetical protein